MDREPFAQPEFREGIEADAVCGVCGTANPEGTLLCKTCGNNLRDQRLLRITADQMLDADAEGSSDYTFLAKALTVLGLLVVLWLGLNVNRISSFLTTPEEHFGKSSEVTNPQVFWEGDDREVYNELQRELSARFPSYSAAETARLESSPMVAFADGLYALYQPVVGGEQFVGAVMVRFQDELWYYTAQLSGNIEIRGMAAENQNVLNTAWNQGGLLYEGAYHALSGMATLGANGIISVSGKSDLNPTEYQSAAYRLGAL